MTRLSIKIRPVMHRFFFIGHFTRSGQLNTDPLIRFQEFYCFCGGIISGFLTFFIDSGLRLTVSLEFLRGNHVCDLFENCWLLVYKLLKNRSTYILIDVSNLSLKALSKPILLRTLIFWNGVHTKISNDVFVPPRVFRTTKIIVVSDGKESHEQKIEKFIWYSRTIFQET